MHLYTDHARQFMMMQRHNPTSWNSNIAFLFCIHTHNIMESNKYDKGRPKRKRIGHGEIRKYHLALILILGLISFIHMV